MTCYELLREMDLVFRKVNVEAVRQARREKVKVVRLGLCQICQRRERQLLGRHVKSSLLRVVEEVGEVEV